MGDAQCGKIREAIDLLSFEGEPISWERYGSGHINDTFRLVCRDGEKEHLYILQRINHEIFTDPVSLMRNIAGVTSFLREKIIAQGGDPYRETLNIVKSRDGKDYVTDSDGNYWRGYLFISGATCFDKVRNPDDFYQSGKAFGHFQRQLAEYPAEELTETIINFHNTPVRLETFKKAVEEDVCGRAHLVEEEIKFVMDRADEAGAAMNMLKEGTLPLRVTHNDTKANNVLFDKVTKEPLVVIDLDTIMPGMSMYDFGDAVRFIANTSAEDEPDTSKVFFDTGKFRAFAKGFIRETKDLLTEVELKNLVKASFSITVEQASRFLDDYLTGDHYFRYEYPKHNLVRARCQLQLAKDIEKKWSELEWIIQDVIDQLGNN